jgi:hypothetical protein
MRSIAFRWQLWQSPYQQPLQRHSTIGGNATNRSELSWLIGLGVAGVLLSAVIPTYWHYWGHLPTRWSSVYHDRNAHYQAALNVACELRQGHILRALLDLDAASVAWPVLHPLLLSALLTVVGPQPEAAVVPALMGWSLATVVAFWFVWRLTNSFVAGWVTMALFLTSPALRVMATDVMLESLGLGLTLLVLAVYALWCQHPTAQHARWLGLTLSILFLHKFNYWGLVVITLGLHQYWRHRHLVYQPLSSVISSGLQHPSVIYSYIKHPISLVIIVLLVISLMIWYNQGLQIRWGYWHWSIRQPRLLIQAAYILLLLRIGLWWFQHGRQIVSQRLGPAGRTLLEWGSIPVLFWLALPFRLQYFLWYAGPGNDPGVLRDSLLDKAHYYINGIVVNYHIHPTLAIGSGVFAVIGVYYLLICAQCHAWKSVLPLYWVLAAVLTWSHPNQQMRFVHTWFPVLWILSGVGISWLINGWLRNLRYVGLIGRYLATIGALGIMTIGIGAPPQVTPWFGRGYGDPAESLREVYDAYLQRLSGREPVAILCNLPEASWRWPYLERFGHKSGVRHNLREIGVFDPVSLFDARRWTQQTDVTVIVYVEIPPSSPLYELPPHGRDNSAILEALFEQSRFQLHERIAVRHLGTVYLWRRWDADESIAITIPFNR